MIQGDEKTPLVTIIMPAYNEETYIGAAIDSILNQTYTKLELIVVDDSSTDTTAGIIKKYAALDARIRYISRPNGGQSAARNTGIGVANGTFIAYHDADDLSHPNRIKKQMNYLLKHSAIDLVYCGVTQINGKGKILRDLPITKFNLYRLLLGNFICCGCVLHRRGILDKTEPWGEDLDWGMWLRISEKGNVACVPERLYFYRVHENNLSITRGWIGNMEINIHIFEERYKRLHETLVKRKLYFMKLQVAIVKLIPGGYKSRHFCYMVTNVFKVIERIIFKLGNNTLL